jgi:trimeric autotransporter adhesin
MPTVNRTFQVIAALSVVTLLGFAAGCRGFFVNPVLTTITVGPTGQNIEQGKTLQLSARGTYDDGSFKTLTSSVLWNSSAPDVASISASGLVTGLSQGTTTITASSESISGTTTVNVVLTGVTAVAIAPTSASGHPGNSLPYTCKASVSGLPDPVDVSANATWTSSDTTNLTFLTGTSPVTLQIGNSTPLGAYTLTCSYTVGSTTFTSPNSNLTVN